MFIHYTVHGSCKQYKSREHCLYTNAFHTTHCTVQCTLLVWNMQTKLYTVLYVAGIQSTVHNVHSTIIGRYTTQYTFHSSTVNCLYTYAIHTTHCTV